MTLPLVWWWSSCSPSGKRASSLLIRWTGLVSFYFLPFYALYHFRITTYTFFFSPAGFPARLWWAAWNQPRCATCPLYHGDFCGPVLSGVCHHQTAEGCLSLQVNRGLLSNDFRSVPLRVSERIRKIIHLVPVDNKGVKWRWNSTFIHAKTKQSNISPFKWAGTYIVLFYSYLSTQIALSLQASFTPAPFSTSKCF